MVGVVKKGLVATTLLAMVAVAPVVAQDAAVDPEEEQREGRWATLGFSTGLALNDNLNLNVNSPGRAIIANGDFALEVGSSNENQRLVFGVDGGLRFEAAPGDDDGLFFRDPTVRLNYDRSSLRSSLGLSGRFNRRQVSRSGEFGFDTDGDGIEDFFDILSGSGDLTTTALGARYVIGRNTPIQLTFAANLANSDFSENNILFSDTENVNLFVGGRLRFSGVTTGLVNVRSSAFTADDIEGTTRDTIRVNVGFRHDFSDVWTFQALVGQSQIDEREENTGVVNDRTSTDFELNATRRLSYGSAFAEIARSLGANGVRTSLRLGGAYALRDGAVSGSLGTTSLEDGDTDIVLSFGYQKELKDGQFSAELDRRALPSGTAQQTDRVVTSLSLGYLKQINRTQSLLLGLEHDLVDADPDTSSQTEFSATYSYELNRDWNMNFGYEHRRRDTGATASSNQFSVSLSRDFELF